MLKSQSQRLQRTRIAASAHGVHSSRACPSSRGARPSVGPRPSPVAKASRCRQSNKRTVQCFTSSTEVAVARASQISEDKGNKQKLTVSWAGAGVFFFWQLGAMKYLAEKYDLTKVPMVGASGGSLAAVLAACGVDADRVIERAYEMSVEHNIWERQFGLLGVWGSLVEKWLDEMLPDNAHELCRDRITVVVTTLPDMGQVGISDFVDKKDLINCCMSSSHVPFFLDFRLTRNCRGKQCVDGSFPDFFTGLNSDLLRYPDGGEAVVFDYFDDRLLTRKGRMDMLEIKTYDEIRRMYDLGFSYAAKLHEDGKFDHYELAEVIVQGKNGHMSEVLVPEHTGAVMPQPVLAMAASHSTSPSQQSSGTLTRRPSMGLVLELQQDEGELAEKLQDVHAQPA